MSLNPLKELKRRLQDDSTPLPKRLCLAKNVVLSHHFPTAPKETIVAAWLKDLAQNNVLDGKELKDVLSWLSVEDLTSELKSELIQVISQYLQKNPLQEQNIHNILRFIENDKISTQLTQQIDDYFVIVVTLLQYLRSQENLNVSLSQRIFSNIIKSYKESKKKLEFIIKLLNGENVETIFSFLDTECRETVVNVCQNVLFPMNKKSFFVSFLQTLIRKDNIDDLMAEKGDNIQSVLKIMSAFFMFPKGRTEKNQNFLSDFIDVFVSCFKRESQLIFAFYIMVINSLNMIQSYLSPAMKMPPIMFEENDEKVKRNLYLKMLEVLLKNEVDISVRLTDTFGEKISKVEIKKNFMSFLQIVMMGQLKLEGKLDKATLQIIKTALKLDPVLIEHKMEQILPQIMTTKKTSSSINESYTEMINCLLEILFKLSRGTIFINQILPHIKLCLEAGNTEQFELKQKIKECEDSGTNSEKLKSKLITRDDIFPPESVEIYGKWTSELMFRQNKELLVSLQKDLEEHCLMMLEEGFVSPSIITLVEVLSAILSSFLRHCKMADHTVPKQISEDFWIAFQKFEEECLGKLGDCVLKLSYNPELALSFLQLCLSVAHLKLLNLKYSNTKLENIQVTDTTAVFDLSALLPCLKCEQWTELASKVTENEAVLAMDNLLLAKSMALQLLLKSVNNEDQNTAISSTKTHLIKEITVNPELLQKNGVSHVLFNNLEEKQIKQLAKNLVKMCLSNHELDILTSDTVTNNMKLLNALVTETAKNMAKCFDNSNDLAKGLADLTSFVKEIDINNYFDQVSVVDGQEDTITNCLDIFKQLPLPYLEESYKLVVIFMLLTTKKCCQKKIRKNVDYILLNIFELSPKYPDLYKIFTVQQIFSFEDKMLLNLLTLKIKTSNNFFIIKSILESAVKKVKTDNEVIKSIVEILLSKQKKKIDTSSIEQFSDLVFQITCIILPIIAKEKKAITVGAYRSILANLQENLHKALLKSFKNFDFGSNSSLFNETNGSIDESMVFSESTLASLNAMAAYSLTLSKYCEATDAEEIKNLDHLWSSLEFFVKNAITAIQNPKSKMQHVDTSIQLLNVTLRHIKKLDSHPIFQNKDKLFVQIWKSIVERLTIVFSDDKRVVLDDIAVTLKFISELISVECFVNNFVLDLDNLRLMKSPADLQNDPSSLTSHKVSKQLWTQILKANLLGPKCLALSKLLAKICKDLRCFIQTHYEDVDLKQRRHDNDDDVKILKVADEVCDVLKVDLDVVAEAVLTAKKVTLDYKLLDSIFSLQHLVHYIIGSTAAGTKCEVTWGSFFKLFEGCVAVLNNLLVSREELLEDRWPNYMQCYRALVTLLCERCSSQQHIERHVEDKLAEIAHSIEKLTQSICKRRSQVSRVAAYSAGDVCAVLERTAPNKITRQHVENCAALLLQAADSSYAAAFLRRALASSPGHATLANMYTMYKRYHKYVGNS